MLSRLSGRLILLLSSPLALVFLGCVSSAVAPPNLIRGACTVDNRLAGTWKSTRFSQLGPASMQFSFACDCTYESRARVFLLMTLREKGSYSLSNGQLSFSRASREITTWPIRFEGDVLILEEFSGESHRYRRTKRLHCQGDTASS